MSKIEFTSQQKQAMSRELQRYLEDELDVEIGQFDADFLLDFITNKFGPAFYNQGLSDAETIMQRKIVDIADELYEIEQPSDF
ncbi:hypothetical protein VIOR3934_08526 [Vibrio orientalis CIP 102891 = ATCC 33934]|uniref:DUF2164 domain-containing protein n=1 Tax=Vibrio orientalis CIP 102891 = ATCC 33934 TaxID=675816 RepID=C9QFJ4_VIBOR|nr:DUF2164 domain-containing protein [Vibrio orientalis]EEX94030.1 hypothetical protein VIA_001188 [Vibrio orientalis CIP 102891 = ATCC 33934]EGU52826.1 hypothetical protein VIOR3934_08526 [Vibrio orientalis CIP 102891 = ATCC 33934]